MGIDETIEVVPYDERWVNLYEGEKEKLTNILGETAVDIQHFGSTSVPGMFAKPIIDILIGVRTLELEPRLTEALEQHGYEGFGEAGVAGRLYFRKRKELSCNLAVVVWRSEQWENNLLIRDYLREHREAAQKYSEKKLITLKKGTTTLLAYSDEKADYVVSLLEQAKKWKRKG
ncbi:MAG TPA: GrpB family protein [Candidatus Bathyarchaeia archaeon]|nr:GrpB family protein [Candidatus Bathyarchaeia archaeon]